MPQRTYTCRGCANTFSYEQTAGRLRVWCDECKGMNLDSVNRVKSSVSTCEGCHKTFSYDFQTKPRTWCDECKADKATQWKIHRAQRQSRQMIHDVNEDGQVSEVFGVPLSGPERVLRLEIMLKSRGTHISQNQQKAKTS